MRSERHNIWTQANFITGRVGNCDVMKGGISGIMQWESFVVVQELYSNLKQGGNFNNLSIYLWLYSPLLDLGRFLSFLLLYRVGRSSPIGNQPVARPLPTHRTTQTQYKDTQTPMPWMRFEPTILPFERAKRVHVLDRAATVIGSFNSTEMKTPQIRS
jgi:hypothetical protein